MTFLQQHPFHQPLQHRSEHAQALPRPCFTRFLRCLFKHMQIVAALLLMTLPPHSHVEGGDSPGIKPRLARSMMNAMDQAKKHLHRAVCDDPRAAGPAIRCKLRHSTTRFGSTTMSTSKAHAKVLQNIIVHPCTSPTGLNMTSENNQIWAAGPHHAQEPAITAPQCSSLPIQTRWVW